MTTSTPITEVDMSYLSPMGAKVNTGEAYKRLVKIYGNGKPKKSLFEKLLDKLRNRGK